MELIMMKRMNHIRNSLEMSHSPREVNKQIREEAIRNRNERIIEIWEQGAHAESIRDLVEKQRSF
jgi:hypothetical protein